MFRRSRKPLDEPALYEYAVGALARKMRTVAELKRLLRQRVVPGEEGEALVESVVRKLKDQKYLNDSAYAAAYSSFRRENEKFGRLRVITDLKVKGVHGDIIEKAVDEAYRGQSEEKLARQFLQRRRLKKPASQKDAARVFRTLARAGFTTRAIMQILKKWDVEDEVLTALESEQD
ncbi:MAG TPA: regulatory protein RecX [Terriglobales bacterium]|nr:regulatory protein RecX [Terriglobales bacterium]